MFLNDGQLSMRLRQLITCPFLFEQYSLWDAHIYLKINEQILRFVRYTNTESRPAVG